MGPWKIMVILLIGLLAWAYQSLRPPAPKLCGSPGGPAIEAPRIKLRDGRYLAYKEHGVPKEVANYKIILVHGFGSSRHEAVLATSELVEKLGIYILSFDRPGYGESDPDPKRTMKSSALDIEELGEQLELGPKFYVIGISMGGQVVWGCLKYIPHRLAGALLIAPVINYWWSSFPGNLVREAFHKQILEEQLALLVTHYVPWLVYWWDPQKWFMTSNVTEYAIQQGVSESLHRDMKIGFGHRDLDPMTIENPSRDNQISVHLWHGQEDAFAPVTLQRYIVQKLPWIHYHELTSVGHMIPYAGASYLDALLKTLLVGEDITSGVVFF